jgi:5-methylcytosine-specific restriction endonuclease McrA
VSPIVRECIDCYAFIQGGSRCPACEAKKQAAHNASRVTRYHKTKAHRERRERVLRRDNHRCHWCGGEANELDYVVPLSRGGQALDSNGVAACRSCNASRVARGVDWPDP